MMADFYQQPELADLLADLPRFTQAVCALAERLNLPANSVPADHIAVRCHQLATAERWRQGLLRCGSLWHSSQINGREICLFRLHQPLTIGHWQIDLLELPYPGEKLYPHEGWEHIECVFPGGEQDFYARALASLPDSALLTPGLKLKQSAPCTPQERLANQTLALSLAGVCIKLHPYSLEQVVASEQR